MRRLVFSFGIVVLLAGMLAGQSAEWKTHSNAEGNFTVQFPGDPKDTVNPTDSSMKSHILQVQQSPVLYMVVWSFIDKEQSTDNKNYEDFKSGVFSKLPSCTVENEQAASPAFRQYVGRGYLLSCDYPKGKVKIKGNLYWGKHYSYALMTAFPANITESAEIKKFMESFTVLDPAK
ncbi:MAG TPA: hypothetical protein VFB79_21245 [Candidatus Angelobacter sp.]|nr:hypothetical protein [Candidatus Angelobacter sp.]